MQWLSGRVLDSRQRGRGFEPHRRHCLVVLKALARHIYPSLVLVQHRKTRPCLTERLLMGHKESNQTNKDPDQLHLSSDHYLHCYTCNFRIHCIKTVSNEIMRLNWQENRSECALLMFSPGIGLIEASSL